MASELISSSERSSPIREKEIEKEEENSLSVRTGEVAESVFSEIGERGSPLLEPIDRVVSIRTSPNRNLVRSIESGAIGMYTRMLSEIKSNQLNEKFRKNGEVTIQAFMLFERVLNKFKNGDRECYQELVEFLKRHHLGFHEDNYQDENGVFSPEIFLTSVEATAKVLAYAYGHARRKNLLPIFFQLALSDGGCFQARSNMILEYGALIDNPEANKELLKALIKIFSVRHSSCKLPVDLDQFMIFIKKTSLSLDNFGVDSQNLREDPLIQELTTKNYFTRRGGVDVVAEVYGHFTVWMMEGNTGRRSFKSYIKEKMDDVLNGAQKTDNGLEKLIDQMLATYSEYPLSDFLKEEKPVRARQSGPVSDDVVIDDFLFGVDEE